MSAFCRFIDSFGFEWQAYEVLDPKTAAKDARRVLYFFSRGAARALDDFPADWETLSWAELEDLCAQGRAVYRDGFADVHPAFQTRGRRLTLAGARDGAGASR